MTLTKETILTFSGIELTTADLDCLNPRQYLNDQIINFYLKYVYTAVLNDGLRQKVHIFDTHFMDAVKSLDRSRLHRWLKHVNIFDKDFLLIPYNFNKHWLLIIICYPRNIINPKYCNDSEKARILIMDSYEEHLRSERVTLVSALYEFIRYACTRQNMPTDEMQRMSRCLPTINAPVKQQQNDYDCGICVLENAEKFLIDAFDLDDVIEVGRNDSFRLTNTRAKRKGIEKLVYKLAFSP